jgi:hypothetical protein
VYLLIAVASAACYAVASVLQHRAAASVPVSEVGPVGLLLRLVRQPMWAVGNVADLAAIGLQGLALRHGSLLAVQAVLAGGVLFALPLGAALSHTPLGRNDWRAAVALVLGLCVLLGVGQPVGGGFEPSLATWLAASGVTLTIVVAASLLSRIGRNSPAGLLAAASGALFALDAAFLKATVDNVHHGALLHLEVIAPAAGFLSSALIGNILIHRAFQLAPLHVGLPALVVAEPVAAIALGFVLFHEHFTSGPATAAAHFGAAVAFAAAALLARHEADLDGQLGDTAALR